ncbi:MAG: carbohydrate ABC transporter permease [Sphaerochaetaceae bacterium]|nr:carbohydrate ABC transporter permease [Sphaerochaetaceae bacterium]
MSSYRTETNILRTICYIVMIITTILCIAPIWLLFINATRSTPEIQSGVSLIPSNNFMVNYHILTNQGLNIWRAFGNSLYISIFSTAVGVYVSMMTAYGIKVYDFKGRKFLNNFILVLVLVPMQMSIIGFYQYMAKLGLLDSYIPLIIPAAASAATVFFALQYMESIIIKDLINAARIDGCTEFGIYNRIMVPIAAPGIFTLSIFGFVGSWNNFFTPFILISKMEKYTLPMLVQTLRGDTYKTEMGAIYLGLAISILPVVIVYLLFARYIVSGISMGAVKE